MNTDEQPTTFNPNEGAPGPVEIANLLATAAIDTDAAPWPPEAQPDHQPDTAGKRVRYDTRGFPHLIDGEMDQPIRWTDTH